VQYNISPETHTEEYWWLNHHNYNSLEAATEEYWRLIEDDPDMGYRIVHRVTQITETVAIIWKMEIEE
jgi:hypothetical protein